MSKKLATRQRRITLPRSVRRMFPNVKHAFDADKPVEISVYRKDCKGAKKLNPSECALARAGKRELHADGVIIGMSSSYVIKGDTAVRFQTPESVSREIVSFDRHQDFAPGDYYLTPKSPAARFGEGRNKPSKHGGDGKPRRIKHTSARVRVLPKGAEA
jgi:hypothetical protein